MISLLSYTHTPSGGNKRDRTHLRESVCRGWRGKKGGVGVRTRAPRGSSCDRVRRAAAATGGVGPYLLRDRVTGAATISQGAAGAAQSRGDTEAAHTHANGSL